MSKARRRRDFLRWKKFRQQCAAVTGQSVPFTNGMGRAWIRAMYRVEGGKFCAMPSWHSDRSLPLGSWETREWEVTDE